MDMIVNTIIYKGMEPIHRFDPGKHSKDIGPRTDVRGSLAIGERSCPSTPERGFAETTEMRTIQKGVRMGLYHLG